MKKMWIILRIQKKHVERTKKVQFMWENHETVMKKLAEAKEEVYQVPNIDLVDYLGYEQYLVRDLCIGTGR